MVRPNSGSGSVEAPVAKRPGVAGWSDAPSYRQEYEYSLSTSALSPYELIRMETKDQGDVIMVVGSCGLDRLLTVPTYPSQDSKIRSTAYHEVGGGNAANTACALGQLLGASALMRGGTRKRRLTVRLASKVGGDAVGERIARDLAQSGIDVSRPLFVVGDSHTTTGFTTIIVSERDQTRTCIHTPGTCGELTFQDLEDAGGVDQVLQNVVHLHSDSRHTDVALALAKEARKRGIPVSVDVEKDRGTKSLDLLLEQATIIFTNQGQLEDYMSRLELEMECSMNRASLPHPTILVARPTEHAESLVAQCVSAIRPSTYFTRWFRREGLEVVITKGSKGSFHVNNTSIYVTGDGKSEENEVFLGSVDDWSHTHSVRMLHSFVDRSRDPTKAHFNVAANYQLTTIGAIQPRAVVDTTGAGDAFIAGFIAGRVASNGTVPGDFAMKLGAWVGGRKVEGPGARTALPTSNQVNEELGLRLDEAYASLCRLVGDFDSATRLNSS